MRCRICGRDCPPESKICRDCASARKRAFAHTVTQPLLAAVGAPSVGEPRFPPKPARRRAANDSIQRHATQVEPAALPLTVVPRRFGLLWLVVVAVLAAAVTALLMRTIDNGGRSNEEQSADTLPPPAVAVPVPQLPPAPAQPVAAPAATAQEMTPETTDNELPKAAPRPRRAAPHVQPLPEVAAPPPPEPAPMVRAPAPPPPRPIETPRGDPWQALNEGLARCGREALFDRIGCEQKLRLQYCGNSWGLVPQCPIGPATDHGG